MNCEVRTQEELDAALKRGDAAHCMGDGNFIVRESSSVVAMGSSRVEARESSSVVARGSSHVEARESSRVEARESSSVVAMGSSHVEAFGSSSVVAMGSSRVEAWGSSHVEARESSRVEARESSSVVAMGSSHVEARESSSVRGFDQSYLINHTTGKIETVPTVIVRGPRKNVCGKCTIVPFAPKPKTLTAWFKANGVTPKNGRVTLYKAVSAQFVSSHNFKYEPGTTPEAPDWDGGKEECGGGLHFCATPGACLEFYTAASRRYVACPIAVKDIAFHKDANYPTKVKARRVCAPIYEVDMFGDRL